MAQWLSSGCLALLALVVVVRSSSSFMGGARLASLGRPFSIFRCLLWALPARTVYDVII